MQAAAGDESNLVEEEEEDIAARRIEGVRTIDNPFAVIAGMVRVMCVCIQVDEYYGRCDVGLMGEYSS